VHYTHVKDVEGRRRFQSVSTSTLIVQLMRRSTLGDHTLLVAAAHAWNAVPSSARATMIRWDV